MTIKKILVAVDGSKASISAAIYAIEMAEKIGASLTVISIISPATYMDFGYATVGKTKQSETRELKKVQGELDNIKQKAKANGVTVKTDIIVKYTSAVKEITGYAEKHKIGLIVTGSRGMSGFKKMLLGSVASGVVTYSHCPVLVVK
jgi:nucleotide-binding universal stress UspA family protein